MNYNTPLQWILVDSEEKLKEARQNLEGVPFIAIDTEYDSLRYFREKLCLIQVASEERTYIFDPLGSVDFSFLGSLCQNHSICKILHAGDNDVRLLNRDFQFTFTNVFDTHRAAGLLGISRLSLAAVIETSLGFSLSKSKKMQRSRWDRRPLSAEQIEYAARDTFYLIELYRRLNRDLEQQGLMKKAREAFRDISQARWRPKQYDSCRLSISEAENLEKEQLMRLEILWRWRFDHAKRTNKARFMIATNEELIALAKINADSLEDMKMHMILSEKKLADIGSLLVEALQRMK